MQKFLKVWNRKGKCQKFDFIFRVALQFTYHWSDFRLTRQLCGECVAILVNMNANQAFCVAIAVLLLQIINIQQQQMFAFLILYQRCAKNKLWIFWNAEHHSSKKTTFPWIRNRPYVWTIPRSAKSRFVIHKFITTRQFHRSTFYYNFRVNRNTLKHNSISWTWDLQRGETCDSGIA